MHMGREKYLELRIDSEVDVAIVSSLLFEEVPRKIARANEPLQGLFYAIEKLKQLMQGFPLAYSLTRAIVNELSPFVITTVERLKFCRWR